MKHHSTASGALLLALTLAASVCAAQSYAHTQATLTQSGYWRKGIGVQQTGNGNASTVRQESGTSAVSTEQTGNRNRALAVSLDTGASSLIARQTGNGGNTATITQAGHHLAASLAQNGGGNQGAIVQR